MTLRDQPNSCKNVLFHGEFLKNMPNFMKKLPIMERVLKIHENFMGATDP